MTERIMYSEIHAEYNKQENEQQMILVMNINTLVYHHHHHQLHAPGQGVAVLMIFFQVVRSCSRRQAVCSPMFRGRRSASIVRVHVCLGRPGGLLHAGGGPRIAARSAL